MVYGLRSSFGVLWSYGGDRERVVLVGIDEALPMVMVSILVCSSSREGIRNEMNLSVHIGTTCMLRHLLNTVALVLHL